MIIIRPIRKDDADAFVNLVLTRGKGMTSLPKDSRKLHQLIDDSLEAFSLGCSEPVPYIYLFVMENTATQELIGTCGIKGKGMKPRYYYLMEQEKRIFPSGIEHSLPLIRPVSYPNTPTEICALYLEKDWRKSGLGKLLSLSRFLFIATFRSGFTDKIIAELRGYINGNGLYVFWEKVGRVFYNVSRDDAVAISLTEPEKTPRLLPNHPIYVDLLDPEARLVLSQTHEQTRAARDILSREGFSFSREVDIIDAGPKYQAATDSIHSIKESVRQQVTSIGHLGNQYPFAMISNQNIDFRVCIGSLYIDTSGNLSIPSEVSLALKVEVGDYVRYTIQS
ncbi:MAG: arginine N-succinyltransferase [Chlamydiales bacterium]